MSEVWDLFDSREVPLHHSLLFCFEFYRNYTHLGSDAALASSINEERAHGCHAGISDRRCASLRRIFCQLCQIYLLGERVQVSQMVCIATSSKKSKEASCNGSQYETTQQPANPHFLTLPRVRSPCIGSSVQFFWVWAELPLETRNL